MKDIRQKIRSGAKSSLLDTIVNEEENTFKNVNSFTVDDAMKYINYSVQVYDKK